jgi:hypothetical protein
MCRHRRRRCARHSTRCAPRLTFDWHNKCVSVHARVRVLTNALLEDKLVPAAGTDEDFDRCMQVRTHTACVCDACAQALASFETGLQQQLTAARAHFRDASITFAEVSSTKYQVRLLSLVLFCVDD